MASYTVYPSLFSLTFPDSPQKEVYFMGLIDILTQYDAKKKAAHAAKTVKHGVSLACHLVCYGNQIMLRREP